MYAFRDFPMRISSDEKQISFSGSSPIVEKRDMNIFTTIVSTHTHSKERTMFNHSKVPVGIQKMIQKKVKSDRKRLCCNY